MKIFRTLVNTAATFGIVGTVVLTGAGNTYAENITFGMGKKACLENGGVWNYVKEWDTWGCGQKIAISTNPSSATNVEPTKVWDGGTGGTCTDVSGVPIKGGKGNCPIPGVTVKAAPGTAKSK